MNQAKELPKEINDLMIETCSYEKDYESCDLALKYAKWGYSLAQAQPPSPDISVLIEALNKINPQNSDGTETEWYKYYGTQVTGEGKESYVHSASCYLACKMAEQELFKNTMQALSQYNNNQGKEEKEDETNHYKHLNSD